MLLHQPASDDQQLDFSTLMHLSTVLFSDSCSLTTPPYDLVPAHVFNVDVTFDTKPVSMAMCDEDRILWMEPVFVDTTSRCHQVDTSCRPRPRTLPSPEVLARRRARRRMLQKGYEKEYRDRKRRGRDNLRNEWLRLEAQLKTAIVAAQNRTMVSADAKPLLTQWQELQAEHRALAVEQVVMSGMMASVDKLQDAEEYFTQFELREQLNALVARPMVFQYEFTWS